MTSILVACVGNIFNGDDAFGVEVARRLSQVTLPDGVRVIDFGIRGIDLTYALMDGYDAVILVDAAQRGQAPGVVSVVEPDLIEAERLRHPRIWRFRRMSSIRRKFFVWCRRSAEVAGACSWSRANR